MLTPCFVADVDDLPEPLIPVLAHYAAEEAEEVLCGLSRHAELCADRCLGLSGLAGSGDCGGEGEVRGVGLLVGGGDPVQHVDRRGGWERDGCLSFSEG